MSKKRSNRQKQAPKQPSSNPSRREVENPDYKPEHPEHLGNPRYSTVDINPRESAVETLYARRFLGAAQKKAADRFAELFQSAGGKSSSLDYTLDRVDGGRGDPVTAKMMAAQELSRARYMLGQRGFDLVQAVCAEGRALSEITPHKRERLTMADNLRADLDDLAAAWGLQTRRNRASGGR